jgi:hypothetical protein
MQPGSPGGSKVEASGARTVTFAAAKARRPAVT